MVVNMIECSENQIPGCTYRKWDDGLEQIYHQVQHSRKNNRLFYTLERNAMRPKWAICARNPDKAGYSVHGHPPILAGPFDSEEEALRAYRTFMELTLCHT